MAKLTKIFENGEITTILEFNGKVFQCTLGAWENGVRASNGPGIYEQLKSAFPDDDLGEYECELDMLDCGDDEEIDDVIEFLSREFE